MKKLGKVKLLAIASLSAVVLIVASIAVAQTVKTHRGQGQRGAWMGRGFHGGGAFKQLNLTDDQKTQIQKIQESSRESDKALFDQMRALHDKQGDVAPGTFDETAFRSAAEARAKIQVELEVSHAKMMSQVFSVLTAEQKAQIQAHHDQMKRMGPPPQPPQPPDEQPF